MSVTPQSSSSCPSVLIVRVDLVLPLKIGAASSPIILGGISERHYHWLSLFLAGSRPRFYTVDPRFVFLERILISGADILFSGLCEYIPPDLRTVLYCISSDHNKIIKIWTLRSVGCKVLIWDVVSKRSFRPLVIKIQIDFGRLLNRILFQQFGFQFFNSTNVFSTLHRK